MKKYGRIDVCEKEKINRNVIVRANASFFTLDIPRQAYAL
jgi:hypothetical protein